MGSECDEGVCGCLCPASPSVTWRMPEAGSTGVGPRWAGSGPWPAEPLQGETQRASHSRWGPDRKGPLGSACCHENGDDRACPLAQLRRVGPGQLHPVSAGPVCRGPGSTEPEGLPAPPARASQRRPVPLPLHTSLAALLAWPPAAFQLSICGMPCAELPRRQRESVWWPHRSGGWWQPAQCMQALYLLLGLRVQATWRNQPSLAASSATAGHTALASGGQYNLSEVSRRKRAHSLCTRTQ